MFHFYDPREDARAPATSEVRLFVRGVLVKKVPWRAPFPPHFEVHADIEPVSVFDPFDETACLPPPVETIRYTRLGTESTETGTTYERYERYPAPP